MTALLAYASNDAANVMADGAYVGRCDGRIRAIETKIFEAAADQTAVLAISGLKGMNLLLCALLHGCSFATFDDAVDGLEPAIIEVERALGAAGFFALRLAGWSRKRNRAEVYKISGGSFDGAPAKPPKLIMANGITVSGPQDPLPIPSVTRRFHDMHRLGCAPIFSAEIALPFFHAARSAPSALIGKHVVGGYVEEVVITAAGLSRRIVFQWPEDRVGELITVRAMEAA